MLMAIPDATDAGVEARIAQRFALCLLFTISRKGERFEFI